MSFEFKSGPTPADRDRAAAGFDFAGDLESGRFLWLPCDAPGCWGASKKEASRCSREPCTRNTGSPDPEALRPLLEGAELITAWVDPG